MVLSKYGIEITLKSLNLSHEQRQCMIAEAAYYKALKRGFESDPVCDWLEAEAEIDQSFELQFIEKFQENVIVSIRKFEESPEKDLWMFFEYLTMPFLIERGFIEKEEPILAKIGKYICPALRSVSNDAFEIAKIITPVLAGLSLVGTVSFPLEPLFIGILSIIIARMGISSFCANK